MPNCYSFQLPANRTSMWCDTRSDATAGGPDYVGEKGGAKYHQLLFIRRVHWRREGSHQRVGQKGVVRTIWFVISLLAAFYGASEVSWGAIWLAKSTWCFHPTVWYPTARRNYFRVDIGTETHWLESKRHSWNEAIEESGAPIQAGLLGYDLRPFVCLAVDLIMWSDLLNLLCFFIHFTNQHQLRFVMFFVWITKIINT